MEQTSRRYKFTLLSRNESRGGTTLAVIKCALRSVFSRDRRRTPSVAPIRPAVDPSFTRPLVSLSADISASRYARRYRRRPVGIDPAASVRPFPRLRFRPPSCAAACPPRLPLFRPPPSPRSRALVSLTLDTHPPARMYGRARPLARSFARSVFHPRKTRARIESPPCLWGVCR